jgi:hypothetical protein
MPLGGRQSADYCKKSLPGGAFEIPADQEVAGRRRGRPDPEEAVQQPDGNQTAGRRRGRPDPEEAVQQLDGNQLVGVLVLLVVPRLVVAKALSLAVGPATFRQIEVNRELVQEQPDPTGGIALEKTPGGTTGDTGQSGAQLGSASAWPRDPVTRLPSLLRGPPITTGAAFIMYRRGQVMWSSRLHPELSFMPFPQRQPWCMCGQRLTIITVEHIM